MFRITIRYHLCSVFKVQFAFVNSDEIRLFFANEKNEFRRIWWAQVDSNHRPHAYQACALTT